MRAKPNYWTEFQKACTTDEERLIAQASTIERLTTSLVRSAHRMNEGKYGGSDDFKRDSIMLPTLLSMMTKMTMEYLAQRKQQGPRKEEKDENKKAEADHA